MYGNVVLFKYRDIAPILESPDFEVSDLKNYLKSKEDYIFKNSGQCTFLAKTTSKWLMYLNGDFHHKLRIGLGKVLFSYDFDIIIKGALNETIDKFRDSQEINLVEFGKQFIFSILNNFIGIKNYESFEKIVEYSNLAARSQDVFVT